MSKLSALELQTRIAYAEKQALKVQDAIKHFAHVESVTKTPDRRLQQWQAMRDAWADAASRYRRELDALVLNEEDTRNSPKIDRQNR